MYLIGVIMINFFINMNYYIKLLKETKIKLPKKN